jgi:hypothetical protein
MLLTKLLCQGFGLGRLIGGLGGALLGWSLLFGGLQFWFLVQGSFLRKAEFLAPEYFIIHKSVPLINLLGARGLAFTEPEIAELKSQPFVKAVAPFLVSRFMAPASIGSDPSAPRVSTDLFFEAIPDEYLDITPSEWHWQEGAETVPIIVPRDYLALYNFGFAQSHNLPQISEKLIGQMRLNIHLTGQGKELEVKGRVAGFSQRINTILVPLDFLRWANANFGEGKDVTSKLIVKTENPSAPQVLRFFQEKNYQYNTEQLKTARLTSALRILLYVVSAFGLIVLVLAFWILALSLQLLISRNSERLQKLIWLGYHPGLLVNRYAAFLLVVVVLVNAGCLALLAWGTRRITQVFTHYGYVIEPVSLWRPLMWMGLLSLLIVALNYLILRRQVFRLA